MSWEAHSTCEADVGGELLFFEQSVAFYTSTCYKEDVKASTKRDKPPTDPLSRREREIMDIVYKLGSPTAAEVRAAMAEPPTDPAVRTTLRILVAKGRLHQAYDGPRYVYSPTVAPEAARRSAFRHLLDTFFGGSAHGAMAALLEMEAVGLSPDERRRLRALVDKADREGR
jgi:BlaI family transcriptional regulator, penicillinase repressor